MDRIAILIVNYNQLLEQSAILREDMMCRENIIFVVDNSMDPECQRKNADYCSKKDNVVYICYKENLGISKAYNIALDEIRKTDFQYILLLDADTEVANEYIEKINSVIQTKEIDLILPIVKTQGGMIMSPCKKEKYGFFSNFQNIEEIKMDKNLSAINSGMCISRRIWEQYEYDEKLFLDYVDHQFMIDFIDKSEKVYIMKDVIFTQNFSAESDDLKKAKFRYGIQMKDIEYFLEKNGYASWCIQLHMWKRKLRLFVKNKKIEILFW